jgi:hypothetical protein
VVSLEPLPKVLPLRSTSGFTGCNGIVQCDPKRGHLHDTMKILICLSRSHDRRRSSKMKFSEPCIVKNSR